MSFLIGLGVGFVIGGAICGVIGYAQALSDAQAPVLHGRAKANGITPQRSAWGRPEIVEPEAVQKAKRRGVKGLPL